MPTESPETYRFSIGKRIRSLREEQGLSLRKLAMMASISHVYLLGIEQGQQNMTLDVLFKIASALDVDPKQLLP